MSVYVFVLLIIRQSVCLSVENDKKTKLEFATNPASQVSVYNLSVCLCVWLNIRQSVCE